MCWRGYIPIYQVKEKEGISILFQQIVIGDQLTVDRAVNALMAQQNGYTEEERMTGLNIGIADWHADMNFLQVIIMDIFYTAFPMVLTYSGTSHLPKYIHEFL